MKSNYKLTHQLIAWVVLLSLFLQSCGTFSNQQLIPQLEESKGDVSSASKSIAIQRLADQEFTAEKGYLVTFHEQDGNLQADVKIDAAQQEPNYTNVPVAISKDTNLSELSHLDTTIQQSRIQVEHTSTGRPSRIVVARGGLKGGMMDLTCFISRILL